MLNFFLSLLRQGALPALLVLVLLPTTGTAATPIVVDTNSFATVLPGETDGLCSLREAIGNVNGWGGAVQYPDCLPPPNNGATETAVIQIQSGIGTINATGAIILRESVKIIGPSPTDKAIITSTSTTGTTGLFNIFPNARASEEFEFRNLRIENIRKTETALVPSGCRDGGAAICGVLQKSSGTVRVIDSEFFFNRALRAGGSPTQNSSGGAALNILGSRLLPITPSVLIEGSTFHGNESNTSVSAVVTTSVDVVIQNSLFSVNTGPGGAVAVVGPLEDSDGSNVTINRSSFIGNESTGGATGALALFNIKTALITNSRFTNNLVYATPSASIPNRRHTIRVAGPSEIGANAPRTFLIMANNEISDNSAGGLQLEEVDATVSSITVFNNRHIGGAPGSGTGIDLLSSALDLRNSTIVGNRSPSSGPGEFGVGGVAAFASTLNFEHVTISGNDTQGAPGAGGLFLSDGSVATFSGTLLADNSFFASNGNVVVEPGSTLNIRSSQFGDDPSEINGTNSGNAFNDIAGLDPLQDMGCTVSAGHSSDSRCVRLAPLAPGATALDRSDPSTSLTSDQRGSLFTRATGGGNLPDIGAHELQPPIISIDPNTTTSFNEGSSGITPFPFTLLRNGDTRDISFANWNVFGEGAFPATVPDFNATSGSAFFDIGDSSTIVNVGVVGDLILENNEGFRLALAALTNGVPGSNNTRTATIINDDALLPAAFVSIAPVAINLVEGNFLIGSEQRFRITRSQVLGGICSFQVELSAVGPAGVSDEDFSNRSLGTTTVTMESGQEFFDYVVQVRGDGLYEGDEAYRVELINPSGCFIDNTAASVDALIIDDESLYRVDANLASQPEGNTGITPFTFEVSRAGFIADSGSVNWEVVGFGGQPASADDFTGGVFPAGTALFLPGSDSFLITIDVVGDTVGEADEQFAVVLTNPSGGEIGVGEAVSTILNDDSTSDKIFSDRFE